MAEVTRAHFLQHPTLRTPVFVRFSTVVGSRGSGTGARRPTLARLSMANTVRDSARGRQVAALVAPGVRGADVRALAQALDAAGARLEIVAPALGPVPTADDLPLEATRSLLTVKSAMFDGVVVPGGADSAEALAASAEARDFVDSAFRHGKPLGALGEGLELLRAARVPGALLDARDAADAMTNRHGIVTAPDADAQGFARNFIAAVAQHRHFDRADAGRPAAETTRARGRKG
jgi:catalase